MYVECMLDTHMKYTENTLNTHGVYMSVRKPLEKSRVDVDALIDGGAKVKEDLKKDTKEWRIVNLRISSEMLDEVDRAVDDRVGITRTGWILESIHRHLKE